MNSRVSISVIYSLGAILGAISCFIAINLEAGLIYEAGERIYDCIGGVNEDSKLAIVPVILLTPLALWRLIRLSKAIATMELVLNVVVLITLLASVATIRCGSIVDSVLIGGQFWLGSSLFSGSVALLVLIIGYLGQRFLNI